MFSKKSEMLSGMYDWFVIIKSLGDAILRAGGDDYVFRQMVDPNVADKIAALLMTRARIPKPTPDTTRLEVFEIEVNGNDPRWSKIVPRNYDYTYRSARTGDFPNKPGKRTVTCALFPPDYFEHDPSTQEVMDEIARRNLTRPDRAITETILDDRKDELNKMLIAGICGVVQTGPRFSTVVGCVSEYALMRGLNLRNLEDEWPRYYRFAAVVSD